MTEQEAIKELKKKYRFLNMGMDYKSAKKHNQAITMAIRALEEIQQYRKIEYELREKYHANVDIPRLIQCFIESVFEGEKHEGFCLLTNVDSDMWNTYRAIGTPEECKEAVEKQKAKKPITYTGTNRADCPICGATVRGISKSFGDWCSKCGQAIDWSVEE